VDLSIKSYTYLYLFLQVCIDTDDGLDWFLCGHQLELAAARALEQPVRIRCLGNVSGLVPDPFGSYIGFSTAPSAVGLFDSTFALLRPVGLLTTELQH